MEKCKKRNMKHCTKSKQCDQFRASIKNEIWYIAQNQSNTTNLEHWKNAKYLSFNIKYVAMEHLCTNLNFYDNINLEWKERIINMKIDRFNVVELKDGNRATIIDVRGKNKYFAEVVNAYEETVAKRNIIDEEIK